MSESIWHEIAVRTTAPVAELVAATLNELGCQGAVLDELPGAPDPGEQAPLPSPDGQATLKAYWSPAWGDLAPVVAAVERRLGDAREAGLDVGAGTIATRELAEESWAEAWKQYFHPLRVGRHFIVAPTWEPANAGPDDTVIQLDPGMAFGTGQHATTQLCLAWLEDLAAESRGSLLDLGCGSGILAIGAAKLGFGPIEGCDIDPLAVQVSEENAALNGVTGMKLYVGGLDAVSGQFDVVVANILAEVIIGLAPQLPQHLKAGGHFLASGIILRKGDAVAAALSQAGLTVLGRRDQGEWTALLARKES